MKTLEKIAVGFCILCAFALLGYVFLSFTLKTPHAGAQPAEPSLSKSVIVPILNTRHAEDPSAPWLALNDFLTQYPAYVVQTSGPVTITAGGPTANALLYASITPTLVTTTGVVLPLYRSEAKGWYGLWDGAAEIISGTVYLIYLSDRRLSPECDFPWWADHSDLCPPTLISPANDAHFIGAQVVAFSWLTPTLGPEPTMYEFWLDGAVFTQTGVMTQAFASIGNHLWQVKALSGTVESDWSYQWAFEVGLPTAVPTDTPTPTPSPTPTATPTPTPVYIYIPAVFKNAP